MLRRDFLRTATAATTFLTFRPASAARDALLVPTEAKALLKTRIDGQKRGTGAVLARVAGRHVDIVTHGVPALDAKQPIDSHAVFQAASLTKIFTAFLLADAVARQEVSLDDPLSRHLPGIVLSFDRREVTLLDLATHTSGLPLRPASRVDRSQDDPYAGYAMADLMADAHAVRLTRSPGSRFEYSNFDYALLGTALAHRTGMPWENLLQHRILKPLDMRETRLVPTPDMGARLVQGYDSEFKPMRPWDFGALAPAGGLYTTVPDLTKFLSLWCDDRNRKIATMTRTAHTMLTPRRPGDDALTDMALGWRIRRDGRPIAWSNGTGGGVRSYMAVDPARKRAVVAFINMATGMGVDDIGLKVLDPSANVDTTIAAQRIEIAVDPAILDRYQGTYTYAPGDSMDIVHTGSGLVLQQGPQKLNLRPESETRFFLREDNITVEFTAFDATGQPQSFTFTQGGQAYVYRRTK